MRLAIRLLLSTIPLGWSAAALGQSSGFFDLYQIERDDIETIESPEPLVLVGAPELLLDPESAPASPDPTLARPRSQLNLIASALNDIPVARGMMPPDRAHLVELRIAGQWLRMHAIEARSDPDFDAVHLTLLAPFSDDYARLTVSRGGSEVVGTVILDDLRYRILPDDFNPEFQLVYPVAPRGGGWTRENPPDLNSRSGLLEARHLQMAWVAENQPRVFLTYADGRPRDYADGPSLGILNFWDAVEFDPAGNGSVDAAILGQEIERYLTEAQRFTWVYERIEVALVPRFETDMTALSSNGIGIEMHQLINSIPISRPLRLEIGPTGEVVKFSGTLMRTDMAETNYGARILQSEAREASKQVLQSQHGIESNDEFLAEELLYNVASDTELDLIWRMSLRADCGLTFLIEIDGITGEVRGINGIATDQDEANPGNPFSPNNPFYRCRFQRGL
jgi:hypothetical protein